MKKYTYYLLALALLADTCLAATNGPIALSVSTIESHPHPTHSFTQGLILLEGDLIESSGHYKKSFMTRYTTNTHKAHWTVNLPPNVFAEGLTVFDDKIFVLTWKSQTLMVFDLQSQKPLDSHTYTGEGWGLTHDDHAFIRSDGSNKLYFHDTATFKPLGSIDVHFNGQAVHNLNELEYARGLIWANIWKQNIIVAIDPSTGQVTAYADLSKLAQQQGLLRREAVLNGIAYDAEKDAFWITGKYWSTLYLLNFTPPKR